MNIVKFDYSHYGTMVKLWEHYGWKPCAFKALPRYGLVAETFDSKFIAYVGMYLEQGKIAFIDWAVVDPDRRLLAGKALLEILDKLIKHADEQGCFYIYSATKNDVWKKVLQKKGMVLAESQADTFIMSLDGSDNKFFGD